MTSYNDVFDEAVDDATQAVIDAFASHLKMPIGDDLSALLIEINDALTAIMSQHLPNLNKHLEQP